jgi:nucleoside 2-deoxyribosyltransferase
MKKIFIIGSYFSDDPEQLKINIKRADQMGRRLLEKGFLPFVPQSMFAYWEDSINSEIIMKACFKWIEECDAVINVTKGHAKKAQSFAEAKGKFIAYTINELTEYFNNGQKT